MPIELPPQYDPKSVEKAIYQRWLDSGAFHAVPDQRPASQCYSIVIPPPNVTGALHLGHAINGAIQDILTRYHRMKGDNTLWMPGIDHAGIATQAVVEKTIFEKEKKNRHDLGREELVRRIWEWKEQFGTRILNQLQSIGASCDWARTRFTLDEVCARAVREAFFKMFKDGLIFRGKRLVNWDTHLQTAVADDEIYHETVKGEMVAIRYPVAENDERGTRNDENADSAFDVQRSAFLVVATTRPETMLGDTAVAVHPEDPRYKHLIGKFVVLPLVGRKIPVIADGLLVDPKFGTGVVKVTPAHDPNDYATGVRHGLEQINLLTPDGNCNEACAGEFRGIKYTYVGLKFATAARQRVLADLEGLGLVVEKKVHEHEVGHSDRSKTPIEPYLSDQWFVRMGDVANAERGTMNAEGIQLADGTRVSGLAQAAMDAVTSGRVKITPERYAKGYLDWLGQKRDWCISRQLWWGHRIPVWSRQLLSTKGQATNSSPTGKQNHSGDVAWQPEIKNDALNGYGSIYVCLRRDDAVLISDLKKMSFDIQDPDVLDTWFSSALWPISTMGWPHPYVWNMKINDEFFDRMDPGDKHRKPDGVCHQRQEILRILLDRTVEEELFKGKDHATQSAYFTFEAVDGGGVRVTVTDERVQAVFKKIAREFDRRLAGKEVMHKFGLAATYVSQMEMESSPAFPGAPEATLLEYFYPTSVLSTAREILTLWVARMVMFGLYCKGDVPFRDVYIHAIIQDGDGRPMKKTLGNGVDPVDIVHSHGADALRFTLASMSTETQDIRLPVQLVCPHCQERMANNVNGPIVIGCPKCKKQLTRPVQTAVGTEKAPMSHSTSDKFDLGRNFANKMWNAARYILMNTGEEMRKEGNEEIRGEALEDRWILSRLNSTILAVEAGINGYRFAEMAEALRSFFWTDLCDWYLEIAKARIKAGDEQVRAILLHCLGTALRLLHPVMPFITEELWSKLGGGNAECGMRNAELLINAAWPVVDKGAIDAGVEGQLALIQSVTSAIREIQNRYPAAKGKDVVLAPRDEGTRALIEKSRGIIEALAGAKIAGNSVGAAKPENAAASVLPEAQIFIAGVIDKGAEVAKLTKRQAELEKFVAAGQAKLANQAAVAKAPANVVQGWRDQLAKQEEELAAVKRNLAELG